MKADWETKTLGHVCERVTVGHVGITSPHYRTDGILFLRTQNVGKAGLVLDDVKYVTPDFHASLKKSEIKAGDVLLSRVITDTVNCALIPAGFSPANCANVVLVRPKAELLSEFLIYYIRSSEAQRHLLDRKVGSAQVVVNTNVIKTWPIPVPPLSEQQRIVGILDEAFDGLARATANAEQNLRNARALFESHLQSVFTQRGNGWMEKSLEELGTITSSKRIFKSEYVESGVPFYRTKEIKQLANGRDITTELFISEARYKEIKAGFGVPQEGDILLTAIGTIGEIWVVKGDNDFYFKDGNVLWLKEFTSINPDFLKYVLVSFVESLNKMAHGSAYSALPIQRLNAHRIFLPSKAEQEDIVATLDSLHEETQRLESIYQQKLAALGELKKSLLHKAFSWAL